MFALAYEDDGGTIIPMFTNFLYARHKNVRVAPPEPGREQSTR